MYEYFVFKYDNVEKDEFIDGHDKGEEYTYFKRQKISVKKMLGFKQVANLPWTF